MAGGQDFVARPVAGALGAEVDGVILSEDLSDPTFLQIRQALLDYQVLFFASQQMTPVALKNFARRFGPLYIHPYAQGLPGHPEVVPWSGSRMMSVECSAVVGTPT